MSGMLDTCIRINTTGQEKERNKYPKVINLPEWANFYVLTIQICLCCYILPNLDKVGWIGVEDEVEALSTRNSVRF